MSLPRPPISTHDETILVLAPTGKDSALIAEALARVGIAAESIPSLGELTRIIGSEPRGTIMLAEEALHPDSIPPFMKALSLQEKWSDIPIILMTGHGETNRVSLQMLNLFTASGNVTLLERPCRAVTIISVVQVALRARRKQYEVRDLLQALESAVAQRDEFMSIASHELKTPLTSLKLQAQVGERSLARGDPAFQSPDNLRKLMRSTNKQLDRLSRLVEDMLDVSRVNTGKLTLAPERVDLSALVSDVLDRFESQLVEADCALTAEIEPDVIGLWDGYRIEQVASNLLSNVIKYGRGCPVRVSLSCEGKQVKLEVSDQGPGISMEDQRRIFDRFERAANAKHIGGLGLGLYISKQIVENHGGKIEVESVPGKGSTFRVLLPLVQAAAGLDNVSVLATHARSTTGARD
jgi:signal transduction histidine kinase